jgi:hypothetical protein
VRERVAAIMGEQRLVGYQKLLETKLATEQVAEVKQAIEWALAEIQRDPIETAPGPVPESIVKQVEDEVKAQTEAAAGAATAPTGDGTDPGGTAPAAPAAAPTADSGAPTAD